MKDEFFSKTKCDRCGGSLSIRTMSWFNDDTICLECSNKEDVLKRQMLNAGHNPDSYEGCDYIPDLTKLDKKL